MSKSHGTGGASRPRLLPLGRSQLVPRLSSFSGLLLLGTCTSLAVPRLSPGLILAGFSISENTVAQICMCMSVLSVVSPLGFCCSLCHHSSVSPALSSHCCSLICHRRVQNRHSQAPGALNQLHTPPRSRVLGFSVQGLCSGFSAGVYAGAMARCTSSWE